MPATFAAISTAKKGLGQAGQDRKVDVASDDLQWIAHVFELALSRGLGKQVSLSMLREVIMETFTRSE